jgi:hypothetical protein
MATAVVSGGVALLLDANPFMTPGQVKIALQMGADPHVPRAGSWPPVQAPPISAVAENRRHRARLVAPAHGGQPARDIERRDLQGHRLDDRSDLRGRTGIRLGCST